MNLTSSKTIFFACISAIILMAHLDAFIFSAPPVVEEGEIQEPPSYIRLRRAKQGEKSEHCYSWEIRQQCAGVHDSQICAMKKCNRCAIMRPGWVPKNRVCMMKTSCFCAAWAGSAHYQSCMTAFSKACH